MLPTVILFLITQVFKKRTEKEQIFEKSWENSARGRDRGRPVVLDSTSLRSTWNSLCVSLSLQSVFEQKVNLFWYTYNFFFHFEVNLLWYARSFVFHFLQICFTNFRSTWNSLCVSLLTKCIFTKMKSVCFDIPVIISSISPQICLTNLSSIWKSLCVSLYLQSVFSKKVNLFWCTCNVFFHFS